MSKVLVFGKSGQIGSALLAQLGERAIGFDREDIDLADTSSIAPFLVAHKPAAVINASAYTQVDKAESEQALAFALNAAAPEAMAQYARDAEIPFIHYSTDYVYDGSGSAARDETTPIAPLNLYGKSKTAGDEAVMRAGGNAAILRTSWVYDATGKNFLTTMLRLMREREELRVVADQIGAPSYAPHLAAATITVLSSLRSNPTGAPLMDSKLPRFARHDVSGIYHLCNAGETSWHGFAEAILEAAKKHDSSILCQRILPIPSSEYPTPARRPLNSRLDCAKIRATFGVALPDWRQGLAEAIEEIYGRA